MAGEDFPQPQPDGEQAQHIPLEHDQAVGEITLVDNNPNPQGDGTNYVEDIHKAETMAYAEDDFRTKAVANRDANRESRELVEKTEELMGVKNRLNGSIPLGRRERKKLEREQDDLSDELSQAGKIAQKERREKRFNTAMQFQEDFSTEQDPDFYSAYSPHSSEARARFYDQQASRLGEWAGLMHDHPLSREFKDAHPGVQFQPKALVRMEDEVRDLESEIKESERTPSRALVSSEIEGLLSGNAHSSSFKQTRERNQLLGQADKETEEEYNKIVTELLEQARALDEFNVRLIDQEKTQPLRNKRAMILNLLNDVRREVGLPVEGEAAGAESSDQPQGEPQEQAQNA